VLSDIEQLDTKCNKITKFAVDSHKFNALYSNQIAVTSPSTAVLFASIEGKAMLIEFNKREASVKVIDFVLQDRTK